MCRLRWSEGGIGLQIIWILFLGTDRRKGQGPLENVHFQKAILLSSCRVIYLPALREGGVRGRATSLSKTLPHPFTAPPYPSQSLHFRAFCKERGSVNQGYLPKLWRVTPPRPVISIRIEGLALKCLGVRSHLVPTSSKSHSLTPSNAEGALEMSLNTFIL